MIPIVYWVEPVTVSMGREILSNAVPVVLSPELIRLTGRLAVPRTALPLPRSTKVIVALRTSPRYGSAEEAAGSWIVARRVTVALLLDTEDANTKRSPVYV